MTSSGADPVAFRRQFPGLEHMVHLASCSLGARSTQLDQRLKLMLDAMAGGAPWPQFEDEYQSARQAFATLTGAAVDQVAVVPSASVGAHQVASTLTWWPRPRLVTTTAEFPGLVRAWVAQRGRGAEVVFVGDRNGRVSVTDYLVAIDRRTALVSIPMTTYRDGVRLPVAAVTAAAHAVGARVFVDAYQAAGVEPIDTTAMRCDYLVTGVAKYLCGLPGVAFLYVKRPTGGARPPHLTSWLARDDPFTFDSSDHGSPADARRYEVGTHAVPTLYAAHAGLALIGRLDLSVVRRHVTDLVDYAARRLTSIGEQLRTPDAADQRGAHVALVDPDPSAMASWLAQRRIAVSPRGDVVRLAVHFYTTRGDIDSACTEIDNYRRQTGAVPEGAHAERRRDV